MGMKNPYPFISTIHIHITLWKGVMRCICECKNWQDMTNCYKRWQRWKNVPVNAIASSHPSDKRCWPQLGIVCVCLTFVCLLLHRPLLPWITLGSRCVKWTPSKTLVWWKICQGFPRISLSQTSDIWQTFEDSFDLYNQASSCLSLLHHCK